MNIEKGIKIKGLKENMYLRYDGEIEKVIDIKIINKTDIKICTDSWTRQFNKNKIIRASFKLTDLIEIKDLINNMVVHEIILSKDYDLVIRTSNLQTFARLNESEIKTILTHEQIKAHSFKVGE